MYMYKLCCTITSCAVLLVVQCASVSVTIGGAVLMLQLLLSFRSYQ